MLHYLIDGLESRNQGLFIEKAQAYLLPKLRGEAMTLAQLFEKQGFEKGIQQGKQETSITIAKKLLAKGLPTTIIEQATGLLAAEIKALQISEEI